MKITQIINYILNARIHTSKCAGRYRHYDMLTYFLFEDILRKYK